MALAKSKTTLGTPGVDTNIGEEINEQNKDRRETSEFNKGLVESGASYDPKTQVADVHGYNVAKQAYNQYLQDYAEYKNNLAKSANISMDSNGKITVKAPSMAIKNPTFQKQLNAALEGISQNYKLNKDYKYALMKDSDETKTSEEWIEDLNKDMEQMVKQAMSYEEEKERVKKNYGVEYTDEDVAKRAAVALEYRDSTGETIKIKDETVQAIPEAIKNLNLFKDLKGWDEDSHMVSWGNLKEEWSREKHSDKDILEAFKVVDDYFKKGDFSDPTEHAEMSAFQEFIYRKDPDVGFWRNVAETAGEVVLGVITGAAEFDAGLFSAIESISNGIRDTVDRIGGNEPGTTEHLTWAQDTLVPDLEKWVEDRRSTTAKLSDARAGWGAVANAITPIAMELAVSVALGNAAAGAAKNATTNMLARTVVNKYGTAVETMGKLTMSNIASGAVSLEEVTRGLYAGVDVIMRLQTAANFAKIADASIKSVKAIQRTVGATAKVADVLAQAVTDVVLSDPKMFRQLMESGDSESRAYALEQLTMNAVGEVAGVMAGKGILEFGQSEVGQVLTAKVSPAIYDIESRIGQTVDDFKTAVFHHGDPDWLVEKVKKLGSEAEAAAGEWYERYAWNRAGKAERQLRNLGERRILRQAGNKVAEFAKENPVSGKTWEEILESAQKINRKKSDLISRANIAINKIYQQNIGSLITQFMEDDSKLKGAFDAFLESQAKVIKVENSLGLGKGFKVFDLGDGKTTRVLDKATNQYVISGYRIKVAEAIRDYSDITENVARAKKEIAYFENVIEEFESTAPQELVDAARDLRQKAIDLSEATQDLRIQKTVMSEEELLRMRNSGFFDDGYMRTQRIKDWQSYRQNGGMLQVRELRDTQSFDLGSTEEFQDAALVLMDDIDEVARQVNRKQATEMLKDIGVSVKTVATEDQTRIIKQVNTKARNKVIKDIKGTTDGLVKSSDSSLYLDFFDYKNAKSKITTQEFLTMGSGGKIAAAKAKSYPVSDRQMKVFVADNIDSDMAVDVITAKMGHRLGDMTESEFKYFLEHADNDTKKMLRQAIKESTTMDAGFGFGEGLSKQTLRSKDYKIRTSDALERYGTWKDVPSYMKGSLSKNGRPIDEFAQEFMPYWYAEAGGNVSTDARDAVLDMYESILSRSTDARGILDYENYKAFVNEHIDAYADLEDKLAKSMVDHNYDGIWDYGFDGKADDTLRTYAEEQAKMKAVFDRETIYRENLEKLEALKKQYDLEGLELNLDKSVDDFIEKAIDINSENKSIDDVFEALGDATAGKDDLIEYATLESLYKNRKNVEGQFYSQAKKWYNTQLTTYYKYKYPGKDDAATLKKMLDNVNVEAEHLANEASEMLKEKIIQRYGESSSRLLRQGSEIPDKKYIFQQVDELNKQITGAIKGPNVIKTYGAHGYDEYMELSPTIANMFTTMPRALRVGPFGALQQSFCRLFRIGTTGGLVPGSLVNQFFRDTGNAFIGGDAWRSSAKVEEELTRLFGERFAKEYQENVPDVFDTLLKRSEETGEDLNRLIVQREMARGGLNVDAQLETNLYQFSREGTRAKTRGGLYSQTAMDKAQGALDKVVQKTDTLNNIREKGLRNRVYNNNLLKGLKEGMSIQEARNLATFMQSEATTNFIRQSYHLANLTHTVPYLGSAINGAKSFWRLYAFDPVGITTRIVGGYVVPVIALTNMTLSNEEDRRIFKQIPEYEKANSLVFVLNGQIISIPMPQEISSFVTPVQHMIESIQGTSDSSFAELMANDLLGAFPIDLSGFVNIDSDSLLQEDIFTHNLIPGFAKVSSTLMGPLQKTAFMYATGVDPYTMKTISRNNVQVDNETGEQYIMDSHTSETAKWIGSWAGDVMSAPMAQKVLQNLFGKGGILLTDSIGQLAQAVVKPETAVERIGKVGQLITEGATKNLTVERYGEESNIAWNRAVTKLWEEKNALTDGKSEKSKKYIADLKIANSNDASETAKKEAKSRIRTVEQEFMQKVLDVSNNLVSKYSGTFDRYKFSSVLSLMNLDSGSVNQLPFNKYSTYLNQQDWNVNRAAAVETMARMGFRAPEDSSIFGYFKENDDGSITIQYNSPLNILNYDYSSDYQDEIAFADINEIVKKEGLYDKKQAVQNQINAIYSGKKKLSNADKAKKEQLQISWNAEVAEKIAPVVARMTPEAAINNKKVRDLLRTYIIVPDSYMTNNKGRRVYSSTLGDDGSLQSAYYESWIKRMFGVNDKYKGQY